MSKTPSFITLRKGIYYFQLRLPVSVSNLTSGHQPLIRRSTRTGNRTEAIKIARKWWFEFMDEEQVKKKMPPVDDINALYKDTAEVDELMRVGRSVFYDLEFQDFHLEHDYDAKMEWVSDLSDFEKKALVYFTDQASQDKKDLISQRAKERARLEQLSVSGHAKGGLTPTSNSLISGAPLKQPTVVSNKRLSDLLVTYLSNKKGEVGDKTLNEYGFIVGLLVDALGNPCSGDVTANLIKDQFLDKIKFFPRKRSHQKYKGGLGFQEIVEIARKDGDQSISLTTLNGHLSVCLSFLNWAKDRQDISEDFTKLITSSMASHKIMKRKATKVLDFEEAELKRIFNLDEFKDGTFLRKAPYIHWGFLLALYTGARVNEIAQLNLKDIKESHNTGTWYIDINEEGDKKVKTENSIRECPIHKDLIKLGFIKYCKHLNAQGQIRLFKELTPDKNGDNSGRKIFRYFNEKVRERVNILEVSGTRKSFHSFRHTFINRAKQQFKTSGVFDQMTGHAPSGGTSVRGEVYEKDFLRESIKKLLDQLDLGIDITLIKPWE